MNVRLQPSRRILSGKTPIQMARSPMQQTFSFLAEIQASPAGKTAATAGYTGFYGFHKYWGKKPREPIAYVINCLTETGQIVLDPFVGSGIAAREALLQNRRFIGIDINPVAVALSRLLSHPPEYAAVRDAVREIGINYSSQNRFDVSARRWRTNRDSLSLGRGFTRSSLDCTTKGIWKTC